jgi:hypothetical protein
MQSVKWGLREARLRINVDFWSQMWVIQGLSWPVDIVRLRAQSQKGVIRNYANYQPVGSKRSQDHYEEHQITCVAVMSAEARRLHASYDHYAQEAEFGSA